MISAAQRTRIERRLGRGLDPGQARSVARLNDMPAQLVQEARRLEDPELAWHFLAFHVAPDAHSHLQRFIRQVVGAGEAVETWERGGALRLSWSPDDLLTRPRTELLAPLGGEVHTTWRRVVPSERWWRSSVDALGSPAVPRPDLTYESAIPGHTLRHALGDTEEVAEIGVALRRWMAARLARAVESRPGEAARLRTHLDLLALAAPRQSQWSDDARFAALGLWAERTRLVPAGPARAGSEGVPGYRGPDAWYEGDVPD